MSYGQQLIRDIAKFYPTNKERLCFAANVISNLKKEVKDLRERYNDMVFNFKPLPKSIREYSERTNKHFTLVQRSEQRYLRAIKSLRNGLVDYINKHKVRGTKPSEPFIEIRNKEIRHILFHVEDVTNFCQSLLIENRKLRELLHDIDPDNYDFHFTAHPKLIEDEEQLLNHKITIKK